MELEAQDLQALHGDVLRSFVQELEESFPLASIQNVGSYWLLFLFLAVALCFQCLSQPRVILLGSCYQSSLWQHEEVASWPLLSP